MNCLRNIHRYAVLVKVRMDLTPELYAVLTCFSISYCTPRLEAFILIASSVYQFVPKYPMYMLMQSVQLTKNVVCWIKLTT